MDEPIRITYFAPRDVLIPRVSRQCIMRFCEALSVVGTDVHLVALDVRLEYDEPTRTRDLWDVYGIEHRFPVTVLPSRLTQTSSSRAIAWHRALGYGAWAWWRALVRRDLRRGPVTIYFRNYRSIAPLFALRALFPRRVRLVLEVHTPVEDRHRRLIHRLDGVVCISQELATDLRDRLGFPASRTLVAHTGVALERIDRLRVSREEARRRLDLPADARIVVYTGKVHRDYREVYLLMDAARHLADDTLMVIVGGRQDHVTHFRDLVARAGPANVRFPGFVSPSEVHDWQFAADALVMYYPEEIAFNDYRSPAKLFEYLASGNPVVAADYRSTREVLTPDVGVVVEPERPEMLAAALTELLDDPDRARRLGANARDLAREYTWQARAVRVTEFLRSLPPR
jgi:glycosyltransferase involved in cell wall biosynthesis